MAHDTTVGTLQVPGAVIHYERRGDGPLLLIIPGGPQDAGVFATLAELLADRHTVVAYDPRGNSRSPFAGEPVALDVDVQADDAAALIAAVGAGPALIFGTSGGAHIGLCLAARYPERVRALVAHDPPTAMLLDDPGPALAEDQALHDTYVREGVEAAMRKFFTENGLEIEMGEPGGSPASAMAPEAAETLARVSGNFEYWLRHGLLPLSRFLPDVTTLRGGSPRVVVGLGRESVGLPIHAMGSALAAVLGSAPVEFPGDHMGFESHAESFAEVLRDALADASVGASS